MSPDHLSSAVRGIQQHFKQLTVKKSVGKLSVSHPPLANGASMLLSRLVAMVTGADSLVQVYLGVQPKTPLTSDRCSEA